MWLLIDSYDKHLMIVNPAPLVNTKEKWNWVKQKIKTKTYKASTSNWGLGTLRCTQVPSSSSSSFASISSSYFFLSFFSLCFPSPLLWFLFLTFSLFVLVLILLNSFLYFQGPSMWHTLGKKKTFNFWIKDGKMFQPLDFCNWACDVTIDRFICDKDLMTVNLAHWWIQKKNQIE